MRTRAWLNYNRYLNASSLPDYMHSLFLWLHTHAAPHARCLALDLVAPFRWVQHPAGLSVCLRALAAANPTAGMRTWNRTAY